MVRKRKNLLNPEMMSFLLDTMFCTNRCLYSYCSTGDLLSTVVTEYMQKYSPIITGLEGRLVVLHESVNPGVTDNPVVTGSPDMCVRDSGLSYMSDVFMLTVCVLICTLNSVSIFV